MCWNSSVAPKIPTLCTLTSVCYHHPTPSAWRPCTHPSRCFEIFFLISPLLGSKLDRELQDVAKLHLPLKILKSTSAPILNVPFLTVDILTYYIGTSAGVTNNIYDGSVASRCPQWVVTNGRNGKYGDPGTWTPKRAAIFNVFSYTRVFAQVIKKAPKTSLRKLVWPLRIKQLDHSKSWQWWWWNSQCHFGHCIIQALLHDYDCVRRQLHFCEHGFS